MYNQRDVAERAGVSIMTVSRVINESGYVKKETRERVWAALQELNYQPNNLGRSLSQGRVNIIAAMAPIEGGSIEGDPYFTRILYGIEMALVDRSYDLLVSTQRKTRVGGVGHFDYLRPYLERKADGLILLGAKLDEDTRAAIEKHRIPCCVIGDRPQGPSIDVIDSTNLEDIQFIMAQALTLGHRSFAFAGIDPGNFNVSERYQGFLDFLRDHGLEADPHWHQEGSPSQETGALAIRRLMEQRVRPGVLVCATDAVALGAILEARRHGLRIPQDLSVTGFDGIPTGRYLTPSLCSMDQDLEAMGRQAVDFVLDRLENPDRPPRSRFFPSRFTPGDSLGLPS